MISLYGVSAPKTRSRGSILDGKSDFESHLPLAHLAFFNGATGFDNLKPTQMFHRLVCSLQSFIDGFFGRVLRCSGELHELVNGIWDIHDIFEIEGASISDGVGPAGVRSCASSQT